MATWHLVWTRRDDRAKIRKSKLCSFGISECRQKQWLRGPLNFWNTQKVRRSDQQNQDWGVTIENGNLHLHVPPDDRLYHKLLHIILEFSSTKQWTIWKIIADLFDKSNSWRMSDHHIECYAFPRSLRNQASNQKQREHFPKWNPYTYPLGKFFLELNLFHRLRFTARCDSIHERLGWWCEGSIKRECGPARTKLLEGKLCTCYCADSSVHVGHIFN